MYLWLHKGDSRKFFLILSLLLYWQLQKQKSLGGLENIILIVWFTFWHNTSPTSMREYVCVYIKQCTQTRSVMDMFSVYELNVASIRVELNTAYTEVVKPSYSFRGTEATKQETYNIYNTSFLHALLNAFTLS